MFCSACGVRAGGNFCSACGCRLQQPTTVLTLCDDDFEPEAVPWTHDGRYEAVLRNETVRAAIAQQAAHATPGISGEAVLELYDQVMASPVPLARLAGILQPFYGSIGVRTGKERSELLTIPIGIAIARTFCSLARHGQTFEHADQRENGCVVTAELPSSVCALKGGLTISLEARRHCTRVIAATNIPGQMYDWGKSQRCLDQLFRDLTHDFGLAPTHGACRAA